MFAGGTSWTSSFLTAAIAAMMATLAKSLMMAAENSLIEVAVVSCLIYY